MDQVVSTGYLIHDIDESQCHAQREPCLKVMFDCASRMTSIHFSTLVIMHYASWAGPVHSMDRNFFL